MSNRIHISIPTPCHENWDSMAPADRGRFCMACQKQVIDFTKASDREIVAAMQQDKNLCGKFRNTQLNRELIIPKKRKGYSILAGFTFLSLLLPAAQKVMAQGSPMIITEKDNNETVADSTKAEPTALSIVIKGSVIDNLGSPLPNVLIRNLTNRKETKTDFDGLFSIVASQDHIIEVTSVGFESHKIIIDYHQEYPVTLDGYVLGGIEEESSFFGRIFHKIGNLFR